MSIFFVALFAGVIFALACAIYLQKSPSAQRRREEREAQERRVAVALRHLLDNEIK